MSLTRLALFTVAALCYCQVAVYGYPDYDEGYPEDEPSMPTQPPHNFYFPYDGDSNSLPDYVPSNGPKYNPGYMMYPMMNMEPNMNGTMPEMYMQQYPMYPLNPMLMPPRPKMTADMFDGDFTRSPPNIDYHEYDYANE